MVDDSDQQVDQSEQSEEKKTSKPLIKPNILKPEKSEIESYRGIDLRKLIKNESEMDSKYRMKFTGFTEVKPSN